MAFRAQIVGALLIGEATALLGVALGRMNANGEYLVFSKRWATDVLACLSAVSLAIGFVGVVVITLVR